MLTARIMHVLSLGGRIGVFIQQAALGHACAV